MATRKRIEIFSVTDDSPQIAPFRAESPYDQFLTRSIHPVVRDLAWCIGSPPLLDSSDPHFDGQAVTPVWCQEHFQLFLSHLHDLAMDPTPLVTWCSARPHQKLGRYFETLMSYWLHHAPSISDIRESVQVIHNGQTRGEFDFLFFDQSTQKTYHLEVAVKFYLRHGTGLNTADYWGPSGIDRLDRKIDLLFEKQLVLGKTDPGRSFLQEIHGGGDVTSLALVKGMIFDPMMSEPLAPPSVARGLSPDCLRGSWVTWEALSSHAKEYLDGRWCLIPRLKWLSPVMLTSNNDVLTGQAILGLLDAHFHKHPDPVMLGNLKYHPDMACWVENRRIFVLQESLESVE